MFLKKLSDAEIRSIDSFGVGKLAEKLSTLSNSLISPVLTAGASGETTAYYFWVAPCNGDVERIKGIIRVVQTGTGNTPTIQLYNKTKNVIIGVSAEIELGGSVGDVVNITINNSNKNFSAGDVIGIRIVNPTGTITVALQALVVFDWYAV